MNTPREFCLETFSLAAEEEVHQACRRYERALHGGNPLSVEDMLSEIQQPTLPLALYELVKIDAEFRQNRGEKPAASDYKFPIDCPHAKIAILTALQAAAHTSAEVDGSSSTTASTDRHETAPGPPRRTIPKQLGRYSIAERLGRGGMGTVFKAFDNRLKRFVALKVPHFGKAGDESIRERFRREALALAALQHDMIVAVHDVEQSGDYEFMTMALIEGETLRRYIHEGHPLAEHQAAILVRALAKAMHYIHDSGVIHRDLKPENVIMEDGRKPVIVDFGLARSPGVSELLPTAVSADLGKHVTRFGQVAGTPEYSSPEQLAGDFDAVGPQTDIYSLGVILFELLTGRLPWNGDEGFEASAHTGSAALQLEACDLNPRVDRALSAICAKAMNAIQADRYRSMSDFADALKPFCKRSAQQAGGPKTADNNTAENIDVVLQEIARQATPKFSQTTEKSVTRKRPVATLAILLVALGSVAILAAVLSNREVPAPRSASSSTKELKAKALPTSRPPRVKSKLERAFPDFAIEQRKAAPPKEPSVMKATASPAAPVPQITDPEPEPPTSNAPPPPPPPPPWRLAVERLLKGGGTIGFQIPAKNNDWREQQVRKVTEIPQQSGSRIVGVVLTRPTSSVECAADLRQVFESFPKTLRKLNLTGIPLDEATISAAAQLPHLEEVVLREVGLNGSLWENLSRGDFSLLRRIDLGGNHIDPAALDLMLTAFEQTAAPLESIGLARAMAIGKQELERIASFPTLVRLDLTDAAVEPAALVRLGDAPRLARLELAGVSLPDGSAKFLERLQGLEQVNLARTNLSDEALTDLVRASQNLSRLKLINIERTRFSSAGVLALESHLRKRGVAVTILAGDRLDFAYRKGPRRQMALRHFQADPGVEPAVAAGIDWLLKNQLDDGLWSLTGPYPNGAAKENHAEATALALLVLQGHGYNGLGKDQYDNAVRRAYRGLGRLVQNLDEPSELGTYGNALAALAVCDLHAMSGFHVRQNKQLPQQAIVDVILARCRELQGNDGGWGEKDRSDALLTGWYVQALTSAEAAGFEVDADMLVGAKKFLEKLWRSDIKRFIYQDGDRRKFILGSHGSTTVSLHLLNKLPFPRAEALFSDKHKEAVEDPYFCYYGTRAAVNAGGELWNLWNHDHLKQKLVMEQTMAGTERGSWFPSNVGDAKGRGCKQACGRFYATCVNLLALEAYYRHLPTNAPVEWSAINTDTSAPKTQQQELAVPIDKREKGST